MRNSLQRDIDEVRQAANLRLDPERKSALGQFMTPTPIADFMASLFSEVQGPIHLLDPGAGVGSLSEAFVARLMAEGRTGISFKLDAFEIEPVLLPVLAGQLDELVGRCRQSGIDFEYTVHNQDFITESTQTLASNAPRYSHALLNPPYRKIGASSRYRQMLLEMGIDTVNLYSAFLALAVHQIRAGGEIVAIVPRSFCNGAYFRPFRKWLLKRAALEHVHVFESRTNAFKEDEVLQENIIVKLRRGGAQGPVVISHSTDSLFADYAASEVPASEIVRPSDPESFIHVPTLHIAKSETLFAHTLQQLGLEVCTGPVVDFRVREAWLDTPEGACAPLLYSQHFRGGNLAWPRAQKKPNALRLTAETRKWLMPRGIYVLTKRFSSKEEKRRIVAYVVDPGLLPYEFFGFENHLNVFHVRKQGLSAQLAYGLALFLNSSIVDREFRNFSGHTQVNATDLRTMRYPSEPILLELGAAGPEQVGWSQEQIDALVEKHHGK